MTKVFVAGLYSKTKHSNNLIGCLYNIRTGIQTCAKLIALRFAPFCCWVDFLYFLIGDYKISEKEIREYTIEYLKVCDVMLVISNAEGSGVGDEITEALRREIPIVYSVNELLNWRNVRGIV